MLKFIIFLVLFFIGYRLVKAVFRMMMGKPGNPSFRHRTPASKYKDVEEADYTEVKSEKKHLNE